MIPGGILNLFVAICRTGPIFLMEVNLKKKNVERVSFSLRDLCELVGASEIKGDPEFRVRGLGPLESAAPDELSFLTDSRYRDMVSECRAGALIVSSHFRELEFNLLIADNPYLALAKAANLFFSHRTDDFAVHPSAIISEGVRHGEHISVGPFASIGEDCVIGEGTRIGGGCYIGRGVHIGADCLIHPRAVILDNCVVGDRVIIHSGVVIGADGFGFAQDEQGRHHKIPQMGIVQIDEDVEIGANTTIDRATFGRTWIKRGAKIDNLVMIAHNVVVGEDTVLVGQAGVSGSTSIGDHVMLGGQVGIAGHLEIGDRAKIGAKGGIMRSVLPDQVIVGSPGLPREEFFRNFVNVQRLPRLQEELKRLREKVQKLEEALKDDDGPR